MKKKLVLICIFYIFVLIGTIISLFSIKNKVMRINRELSLVNNQISQEKDNIQILEAELAYLTTPERINYLRKKYLNLKDIDQKQIIKLDE